MKCKTNVHNIAPLCSIWMDFPEKFHSVLLAASGGRRLKFKEDLELQLWNIKTDNRCNTLLGHSHVSNIVYGT